MKTFKNTIATVAIAASFVFSMKVQAQIASYTHVTPDEVNNEVNAPDIGKAISLRVTMRPVQKDEKIELLFGKIAGTSMTITLFDAKNRLYYEKLGKNEKGYFSQNYDIKDLPNGQYQFVIQNGSERIVKKFEIQSYYSRVIAAK